MEINISIYPCDAIRAGSAQAGNIPLTITDEFVAGLSAEEREELILIVTHGVASKLSDKRGMSLACPNLHKADLPSLAEHIRRRISIRKEADRLFDENEARIRAKEEENFLDYFQKWYEKDLIDNVRLIGDRYGMVALNCQVPESKHQEYTERRAQLGSLIEGLNEDRKRQKEETDLREKEEAAEQRKNTKAWVAEHGSVSMQQREAEGLLPERELLDAVRDQLFEPLVDFSRYGRLVKWDARHHEDCDSYADYSFATEDADELTHNEYQQLLAIRSEAKQIPGASVQAREHRVVCQGSKCPDWTMRRSALVMVEWNGHKLSREYALTAPGEDTCLD